MDKKDKNPQKRTKAYEYLEEALVLLMREKKLEDISVRALVDKAGISRTAFYAQFTCKQDFVDSVIAHTHSGATILSTDYQSMSFFSEESFVAYYIRFYNYVASKARLYTVMLSENGPPSFREKMRQEALHLWQDKHFTPAYMAKLSPSERKQREVMISYVISAHIGLIEYWLAGNMEQTPEFMAEQLYRMTWQILKER